MGGKMFINVKRALLYSSALMILYFSGLSTLSSQALNYPLVISAKGTGFTLGRNGQAQIFNAAKLPQERITLATSDMLQTGKGDFVELALLGSDAILYLAENTSIVYTGSPSKEDSITLIYGRLRISAKGARPVIVKTGNSSSIVNSGDANIDYTVLPAVQNSQKPVLRTSTLPSTLTSDIIVLPKSSDPVYGRIVVKPGETLLVDPVMNNTERITLDKSVVNYWSNFLSASIVSTSQFMPGEILPVEDEDISVFLTPFDYQASTINLKTGGIIAGVVCVLAGIALQGVMFQMKDDMNKDTNDLVYNLAYVPIGLGTFTLLASYFYKTPPVN
jgi:hypothetical protein